MEYLSQILEYVAFVQYVTNQETMRDFFARTADFWQKYALEKVIEQDSTSTEKFKKEDEKALKRDGKASINVAYMQVLNLLKIDSKK